VTAPAVSRGPGALVAIVMCSVSLAGCASGSSDPSTDGGDLRDDYVGTWTRSADGGLSSLVLSPNGTFEAHNFPAALVCGRSTGGREIDACRSNPGTVSAGGTWWIPDEEQGTVWLDSDGISFSTAYRNFDSFFGKSFSLGFYVGSIDKPKPDYLLTRR
jgi:hypothetical protein